VLHELGCPRWLFDPTAWKELQHHGLEVQHRRSVDGIEVSDVKHPIGDSLDRTDCAANAIGSVLATLGEDADRRPIWIVTRTTHTRDDLRRLDNVENEDDLDVRESIKAGQRVGRNLGSQRNARLLAAPVVVFRPAPGRRDDGDRFHFERHGWTRAGD